jgi:hypothetical protein
MSTEPEELAPLKSEEDTHESNTLRVIGWFSIGMAVAASASMLGAELRSRYKFKRAPPTTSTPTPANTCASEFGMGI